MKATSGFTLIEIVAVIFIMGLLAVAAVLSLAHTAAAARTESLRRSLEQADALVRSAARQSGRQQHLIFDLAHEEILWQAGDNGTPVSLLKCADNDSMTVRVEDRGIDYGKVQIDFSPAGYSRTYAVKLEHDHVGSLWMVVAGMTGRIAWTEHDDELDNLFKSLDASGKPDEPENPNGAAPDEIAGTNAH